MFRKLSLIVALGWICLSGSSSLAVGGAEPCDSEPAAEQSDTPENSADAPAPDAPEPTEGDTSPGAESDAGRTYDLKYKFAKDEVLESEVIHQAVVQTTIQGNSQTAETHSKSQKVWRVTDVTDDGNTTFVHMVGGIEMRQKMQGRPEIQYNSSTDATVPAGYEDVAAAVGVPLTIVTMDCRGKILKRQEKRHQPGGASTQMTMPLPEVPIAIGETWTSPVEIEVTLKDNSKKKIKTRQQFTLQKVVEDLATIEIDSQILTPISDPAIEAQLVQRLSSGTVRFDIAQGRVLDQQLDLDRNVIGFSGPTSSMHYVTRFRERLVKSSVIPSNPTDSTTVPEAAKPKAKTRR